ncbi:MAG: hypothetical protein H6739_10370 [Alphaproteobacteria bacterium]|nr:hypothetical protein [Alphaproteobacteria bacterium]
MPLDRALAFLDRARNPDGSLGYLPSSPGQPEPTLLAVAAGVAPPVQWLSDAELGWGALIAPAVLGDRPETEAIARRAIDRILSLQGEQVEDASGVFGFDPTGVVAWGWVEGTAPWVEPTCYALISLKRTGHGDHARVRQGEAMLLDRQCADGGWNYGNPAVLGAELESYLPPTAWAAMALPPSPAVDRALARLLDAQVQASTTTLALAILARAAHGLGAGPLPPLLLARQDADGGFGGRCDRTALAACALGVLDGGPHPFSTGGAR